MTKEQIINLGTAIRIQCEWNSLDGHIYGEDTKSMQGQWNLWLIFNSLVQDYLQINQSSLNLAQSILEKEIPNLPVQTLDSISKSDIWAFYYKWTQAWIALAEYYQGRTSIEVKLNKIFDNLVEKIPEQDAQGLVNSGA